MLSRAGPPQPGSPSHASGHEPREPAERACARDEGLAKRARAAALAARSEAEVRSGPRTRTHARPATAWGARGGNLGTRGGARAGGDAVCAATGPCRGRPLPLPPSCPCGRRSSPGPDASVLSPRVPPQPMAPPRGGICSSPAPAPRPPRARAALLPRGRCSPTPRLWPGPAPDARAPPLPAPSRAHRRCPHQGVGAGERRRAAADAAAAGRAAAERLARHLRRAPRPRAAERQHAARPEAPDGPCPAPLHAPARGLAAAPPP